MEALAQQLPQIIAAAARSELGILALLVVALAGLAYVFFARASERARLAVFVLLFAGVVGFAAAMFRAAPRQSGNAPVDAGSAFDPAGLSAEAQVVLREAAADPGGTVTLVHYGGGSELTANDRNLLPDPSRRTLATWEAAVQELLAAGLLSAGSPDAEVFHVTREGYEVAGRLRGR
jgi:hypothetical protein